LGFHPTNPREGAKVQHHSDPKRCPFRNAQTGSHAMPSAHDANDERVALDLLVRGFQLSRMLRLVADLGVADRIAVCPISPSALTEKTPKAASALSTRFGGCVCTPQSTASASIMMRSSGAALSVAAY
jgi:hypothetical protein